MCFIHASIYISVVLSLLGRVWCRRHSWTSHRVKNVSQCDYTEVRPGMNARIWPVFSPCCSLFNCFSQLFSQFLDSPGWFAVLTSRLAAKLLSDDSTPPGPEHHGLSAVALGSQQCHDYQSGARHKEQSLYTGFAGKSRFINLFILNIYFNVVNHFFSHSHLSQLGVPHSYLMMSYHYKFQDDDQTKVKGSVK